MASRPTPAPSAFLDGCLARDFRRFQFLINVRAAADRLLLPTGFDVAKEIETVDEAATVERRKRYAAVIAAEGHFQQFVRAGRARQRGCRCRFPLLA